MLKKLTNSKGNVHRTKLMDRTATGVVCETFCVVECKLNPGLDAVLLSNIHG